MIPGRHFAGLQLQGGRPYQEDDFGFLNDLKETDPRPSHLLVVLADGMGGHSGGAHASAPRAINVPGAAKANEARRCMAIPPTIERIVRS